MQTFVYPYFEMMKPVRALVSCFTDAPLSQVTKLVKKSIT